MTTRGLEELKSQCGDIDFSIGSAQDVLTEGVELSRANNAETGHNFPLDIDEEVYLHLEKAGGLRVYLARSGGQLAGYAAFFLTAHPHHRTVLLAQQDVIYIDPGHRGCGGRFISWIDEKLTGDGVQMILHHVTVSKDFSPLLERLGYAKTATVYTKIL